MKQEKNKIKNEKNIAKLGRKMTKRKAIMGSLFFGGT